ncbi:MAG: hypothetical protein V3U03_07020 [Myxococcota bacterium]
MERTGRALRWLLLALAALAVAHTLSIAAQSNHALPFADQWGLIKNLVRYEAGELGLGELLWKQHNEHRWLVPRLFFLVDVFAFDARNSFLIAVIVALQALHAALLVRLAYRTHQLPARWTPAVAAVVFVCLFSATQIENFESGLGLPFAAVALAATAAFAALARAAQPGARAPLWLAAALLAGAASATTMANGLLVWPILVGLAVWLRLGRGAALALAAGGLLVGAVYFAGYAKPPRHPDPIASLAHPLRILAYTGVYVGGPFRGLGLPAAGAVGGFGLWLAALAALRTASGPRPPHTAQAALVGVLAFAAGTALLSAVGRATFPLAQATASRYATFALLLWGALAALLPTLTAASSTRRRLALLAACGCVALTLASFEPSIARGGAARHRHLDNAALALLVGVDDYEAVAMIHPKPLHVFDAVGFLERHRLSIFAVPPPAPFGEPLSDHYALGSSCLGLFRQIEPVAGVRRSGARVAGWAWDAQAGRPPDTIVLVDAAATIVGAARTGIPLPGVAQRVPAVTDDRVGWRGYVAAPPGTELLAYALAADGVSLCLLPGRGTLSGPER